VLRTERDGVALREDVGDGFQNELALELLVVGKANGGDVNDLVTEKAALANLTVGKIKLYHHHSVGEVRRLADLCAGALVVD
jgi:hypothetical protein